MYHLSLAKVGSLSEKIIISSEKHLFGEENLFADTKFLRGNQQIFPLKIENLFKLCL